VAWGTRGGGHALEAWGTRGGEVTLQRVGQHASKARRTGKGRGGGHAEVWYYRPAACKSERRGRAGSMSSNESSISCIRQHMSANVSIGQHTSAYGSMSSNESSISCIRQYTSAYVSIRQHIVERVEHLLQRLLRQYSYFCSNTASKLSY
jgi:hypothetical protein